MSNVNVETLMYDRIETVDLQLNQAAPGTPEHKALADEFAVLMGKAIEIDRVDRECEDKTAARKDERRDRLIKNIIGAAGVVLPLVVTIWGTKVSLKFEETGTVTTQMGRGFIQRLFPKK